jgi:hypothetical protein
MPCDAMPCDAVRCRAMLCDAMPCRADTAMTRHDGCHRLSDHRPPARATCQTTTSAASPTRAAAPSTLQRTERRRRYAAAAAPRVQLSATLLSADVWALHRVGAQTVPCCSGATRRLTHTAGLTAKAGSYRGTQPPPTRSLSASTVCTGARLPNADRDRVSD